MVNRIRYRDIAGVTDVDSVLQVSYTSVDIMPTMTSSSQNGFVITASSDLGTDTKFYAFDKTIDANGWHSNNQANNRLQVQLPVAKTVTSVALRTRYNYSDTNMWGWVSYVFTGSNNGTDWTTLGTFTDNTSGQANTLFTHSVSNTTAYTYYRMTFSQNSTYCFVSECTLLGY